MLLFRLANFFTSRLTEQQTMKLSRTAVKYLVASSCLFRVTGFGSTAWTTTTTTRTTTPLFVSTGNIGLGPAEETAKQQQQPNLDDFDYEIPNHEEYRTSRRSKMDEQCDRWFGTLLGNDDDGVMMLGDIAQSQLQLLMTPVELKNEVRNR